MPSSNFGLQSLGPRLPLILTTVVGLAGTFFIGAAIGQGEFIQVYLLLFAIAALTAIFTLGSKYWLLIPIAFSFNLPAIPFGGRAFELPEITIVLCAVVFAFRYALHTRGVTLFRWSHTGLLLYSGWAAIIFVLHPVGLFAMGSSSGGARFYFKIALALASFLIVANQNVSERDAKWLIRLLLIGSIVGMVVNIVQYKISPPVLIDPNAFIDDGYYTWHQALSGPAMMIVLWLFSRYKTKEIFGFAKPHLLFLFFFCVAVAAISGKRAGFASVLLTPLIAAILRKEYFYVLTGAILAALLIFILSIGQGSLFRLPLQVQRTLSYLPGKWDWEVRSQFQGGIDPFRKELRDLAWKNIEEHPFVGQGYAVNVHELFALATERNLNMIGIQAMALGSSWHNTWLGIWADFGFPAVIFWAIFWIQGVAIGYHVYRRTLHGSAFRTLAMMILLYFIGDIFRSWTSGHSADDPFTRWWMYGVLLSLALGLEQTKDRNVTDSGSPRRNAFWRTRERNKLQSRRHACAGPR
jgi:O-antigen ligase